MLDWEEDKQDIVSHYYTYFQSCHDELRERLDKHQQKVAPIYGNIRFIVDRIAAVWFLTQKEMVWDADIIDRTVLESLVKVLFIIYAPYEAESENRINEFWEELWEVNLLKHSEDAKRLIELFPEAPHHLSHGPMVLSEEAEATVRTKWNRKSRKALEQKWSFSEMLVSLSKSYKGVPFEGLMGLAYQYRGGSHIAHGDETGIGIIADRASRGPVESQIPHRGHSIKLMSNCLTYSSWLAVAVMDFIKEDKQFFFDNLNKISAIKPLEAKYTEEVYKGPEYDEFRKPKP